MLSTGFGQGIISEMKRSVSAVDRSSSTPYLPSSPASMIFWGVEKSTPSLTPSAPAKIVRRVLEPSRDEIGLLMTTAATRDWNGV